MPIVFRYFWFIGAAFMLVNIMIWRRRLDVLVVKGLATVDETNTIVRGLLVWLVGAPLLLGTIALGAGWSSPFCAGFLAFGSAAQSLVSVITVTGYVTLLWWVWRGSGAELLARIAPAMGNKPDYDRRYSPAMVRLVVTAGILFSTIGTAINMRVLGAAPDMGCRVVTVAR